LSLAFNSLASTFCGFSSICHLKDLSITSG
jgi:hypothetical protein